MVSSTQNESSVELPTVDSTTSLTLADLLSICGDLQNMEKMVDGVLASLDLELGDLHRAISSVEVKLNDGAKKDLTRKYDVPGYVKLRYLLDDDAPTFSKVDEIVAERYRKILLSYYHPDKLKTADPKKFELVKYACSTANIELLAAMVMETNKPVSSDVSTLYGVVFRRLHTFKTKNSYKIAAAYHRLGKDKATQGAQDLIDQRAKLFKVSTMITR